MKYSKQLAALLTGLSFSLVFSAQSHAETNQQNTAPQCKQASQEEIAQLFDRWNAALQTGSSDKVVERYAEQSILLPTVSGKARLTPAEKKDYFDHFLAKQPVGKIDHRQIQVSCNTAVDTGHYTFILKDGDKTQEVAARYSYAYQWSGDDWYIISHHSSVAPSH